MRTTYKKVAIFGHYGVVNLGDETIISAVIQSIRRHAPETTICGFSLDPDDTTARHGIEAFPVVRKRPRKGRRLSRAYEGKFRERRALNHHLQSEETLGDGSESETAWSATTEGASAATSHATATVVRTTTTPDQPRIAPAPTGLKERLKATPGIGRLVRFAGWTYRRAVAAVEEVRFCAASYRRLRSVDLLLIAGSGQITDAFGGITGYPYRMLKWFLLARLAGTRIALASCGAGPIYSGASRLLLRTALGLASYRSYRDIESKELVESIGVRGENHVFPDLANAHSVPAGHTGRVRTATDDCIVGINPIPFRNQYYWYETDLAVYRQYIADLAEFSIWLADRGVSVILFPMQLRADPGAIDDVWAEIESRSTAHIDAGRIRAAAPTCPQDLIESIADMDYVVSARFHGILISSMMSKPTLAMSYSPKFESLTKDLGTPEYCFPAEDFGLERLKERFESLDANREQISARVRERVGEYRRRINHLYERILSAGSDGDGGTDGETTPPA